MYLRYSTRDYAHYASSLLFNQERTMASTWNGESGWRRYGAKILNSRVFAPMKKPCSINSSNRAFNSARHPPFQSFGGLSNYGSPGWTRTNDKVVTLYPIVSNRSGLSHHPRLNVRVLGACEGYWLSILTPSLCTFLSTAKDYPFDRLRSRLPYPKT